MDKRTGKCVKGVNVKISVIAAMAINRVIGINNEMPWHLPADFAWFRRCTLGKPVIMGRKTFESIGRALPQRLNIVISRDASLALPDGVILVNSLEAALQAAGKVEEVMVIGGSTIYQAALPMADRLYLTQVDAILDGDALFPIVKKDEWKRIYCQPHMADDKNAYAMEFQIFERQD